MKFIIKHEISGRIRIHFSVTRMTCQEADILLYYFFVDSAKVCERTADAVICYTGKQEELLRALCHYGQERAEIPESAAFGIPSQVEEKKVVIGSSQLLSNALIRRIKRNYSTAK